MAAFSSIAAGAMIGLNLMNASQQAGALTAQNEFQSRMTAINIRRAERQKEDAMRRGENEANKYRTKVGQLVGAQKVALAAQGIDISSGSANDLLQETQRLGEEDAKTIETNAFMEALGYDYQIQDYRTNQSMNNISTQTKRNATYLGGAISAGRVAFDQWGGAAQKTGLGNNSGQTWSDNSGGFSYESPSLGRV